VEALGAGDDAASRRARGVVRDALRLCGRGEDLRAGDAAHAAVLQIDVDPRVVAEVLVDQVVAVLVEVVADLGVFAQVRVVAAGQRGDGEARHQDAEDPSFSGR